MSRYLQDGRVAIWFEPLADILKVTPPSATGWAIIAAASPVPLILGQLYLAIEKHRTSSSD
jgi:hypothetical protein